MDKTFIESKYGSYRWEILIFSPLGAVAHVGPEENVIFVQGPFERSKIVDFSPRTTTNECRSSMGGRFLCHT